MEHIWESLGIVLILPRGDISLKRCLRCGVHNIATRGPCPGKPPPEIQMLRLVQSEQER